MIIYNKIMNLSAEAKREIHRRLTTFLEHNGEWIPVTYRSLNAIINKPIITKIAKSGSFDDPSSYSALLLYLNNMFTYDDLQKVYTKKHGIIPTMTKNILTNEIVKTTKKDPSTIEYINNFISAVFEDVGPVNAKCPFERPAGVTNMYFQDLNPLLNYAINKHFDPKREFNKDYFIELSQLSQVEVGNMNKVFDYIMSIWNNPLRLYTEYNSNPDIRAAINYSNDNTKQTLLKQLELGRQLYYKTTVQDGMMTGTTGDFEFVEQMKSGLDDFANYDALINKWIQAQQQLNPDKSSVDGPTPQELLEYCNDLVETTEMGYDDTTTKSLISQLWQKPLTKFAVGGIGLGALGLTGYGLYKLWQSNKQRREAEEELDQLKQQQKTQSKQKPVKQRKNKPTIINNVGYPSDLNYGYHINMV